MKTNQVSEKKFVKSSLGQIIDYKMLWSKSEHFETSLFETHICEPKYLHTT